MHISVQGVLPSEMHTIMFFSFFVVWSSKNHEKGMELTFLKIQELCVVLCWHKANIYNRVTMSIMTYIQNKVLVSNHCQQKWKVNITNCGKGEKLINYGQEDWNLGIRKWYTVKTVIILWVALHSFLSSFPEVSCLFMLRLLPPLLLHKICKLLSWSLV